MIADLKDKFAQVDRKRLYTAAAALVIAGAAGHFMQRGSTLPGTVTQPAQQPMQASMGAPAPVAPAAVVPPEQMPVEVATTEPVLTEPAPEFLDDGIEPVQSVESQPELDMTAPDPMVAQADAALAEEELVVAVDVAALPEVDPPLTVIDGLQIAAVEDTPEIAMPVIDEIAPVELVSADDLVDEVAPVATDEEPLLADACTVSMTAMPSDAAQILLEIEAPCRAAETVEIEHLGLRFSEQMGPSGALEVLVPAMAQDAVIVAEFADGTSEMTSLTVPDFAEYERIALVWKGATGLQLHALENGASYAEAGHVWAEAPGMPASAIAGVGGFVSVLGSTASGYAADVYTYPASHLGTGLDPRVSVEAQVMENTCGTTILGDVVRGRIGREPLVSDVSIAVPGCDLVGEYLVLQNLPQDLKIARN